MAFDFNYAGGSYLIPGYTRSGEATALTAAGKRRRFGAGAPRVTDRGLTVESSSTNVCVNHNLTPTTLAGITAINGTTVSVVAVADLPAPVRTALLASEVGDIVTAVYKVATPGLTSFEGVQVDGNIAANTSAFLSVFCYVESGPPPLLAGRASAGAVFTSVRVSSDFQRSSTSGTNASARPMGLLTNTNDTSTPAAGTFYFIGNQLEATRVTSLIPVAGAAATRAADALTPVPVALAAGADLTLALGVEFVVDTVTTTAVMAWNDGTTANQVRIERSTGGIVRLVQFVAGASQDVWTISKPGARTMGIVVTRAAGKWSMWVDGVLVGADKTPTANLPALTTVEPGTSSAAANPLRGYLYRAQKLDYAASASEAAALSVAVAPAPDTQVRSGVSYPGYAAEATWSTAQTMNADFPITNLSDLSSIRRVALRTTTAATTIDFVLSAARLIDFLAIVHHNAGSDATVSIQLSSGTTPTSDIIWSSGTHPLRPIVDGAAAFARTFPHRLPTPVLARSGRLTFSINDVPLEIGGVEIGQFWEWPDIQVDREIGIDSTAVTVNLADGADHVTKQWAPRVVRGNRGILHQVEVDTTLLDFHRAVGRSKPFVWCWDANDTTTWARQCMLVTNSDLPLGQVIDYDAGRMSFALKEHLR